MKAVGKWSYLGGLLLAIVGAFVDLPDLVGLLIVILAVLAGLFLADPGELTNYGVRYLALVAVAAALDAIPGLGPIVTSIAGAMVGFFGPIILTVLLVFNWNQAVAWIQEK